MASRLLAVRDLSRRHGGFVALRDLALELHAGECVAVLGRNGSGKTTAIRMIAGLLEPTSGVIEIGGQRVTTGTDDDAGLAARAALALVPDNPQLYDDLTVSEHLELVALAHGVADGGLEDRIDAILERLGLSDKLAAHPGQLSRGMRQKVQLACALIRPFELLVLDEPIVGLDPASQQTLREILGETTARGAGVLFSTHQLEFARGIADRAIVLADGVVVAEGGYDEVIDGPTVREWGLA